MFRPDIRCSVKGENKPLGSNSTKILVDLYYHRNLSKNNTFSIGVKTLTSNFFYNNLYILTSNFCFNFIWRQKSYFIFCTSVSPPIGIFKIIKLIFFSFHYIKNFEELNLQIGSSFHMYIL